ncbi:MAG: hypothetical protein R2716_12840 [Microthrixaceae bacterium]
MGGVRPGTRRLDTGAPARKYPEGFGQYLEPGTFIVNQVHYHYDHDELPDRSAIALEVMPQDEVDELEAAGRPLRQILGRTFINPAEARAPRGVRSALADRDAVLEEISQKYGMFARFLPDAFVRGCGGTVDGYDDLNGTVFSSTCDHRSPLGHALLGAAARAQFGAAFRMTINPDTDDEVVVIDIPEWNFDWQLQYQPPRRSASSAATSCGSPALDRSLVEMPEPRYITWSDGTVDRCASCRSGFCRTRSGRPHRGHLSRDVERLVADRGLPGPPLRRSGCGTSRGRPPRPSPG